MPVIPSVLLHELWPLQVNLSSLPQHWMRPELLRPQTFARLQLHEYVPGARRVIWLDHDTIIRWDIGSIYRMRMHHPLAAAWDWGNGTFYPYRKMVTPRLRARLPPAQKRVFNSGVLVFDLDRWKSEPIAQLLNALMPLFVGINGELLLLNLVVREFDLLDWRWNTMGMFLPLPMPKLCLVGARILHWTWDNKPWLQERPELLRIHDDIFQLYAPRRRCDALPNYKNPHPATHVPVRRVRISNARAHVATEILHNFA